MNIKLYHQYRAVPRRPWNTATHWTKHGGTAADVLFGIGDDKTQVTGVINYYHHNSVFNRDRGFSNLAALPELEL